jgi:hypothetical protein
MPVIDGDRVKLVPARHDAIELKWGPITCLPIHVPDHAPWRFAGRRVLPEGVETRQHIAVTRDDVGHDWLKVGRALVQVLVPQVVVLVHPHQHWDDFTFDEDNELLAKLLPLKTPNHYIELYEDDIDQAVSDLEENEEEYEKTYGEDAVSETREVLTRMKQQVQEEAPDSVLYELM